MEYFLVVLYFDEPVGQVKIQTIGENTLLCYMPKHLINKSNVV